MLRLVLDTNVVISAFLWGGTPRLLIDQTQTALIDLYSSEPLMREFTDLLDQAKFQRRLAHLRLESAQVSAAYMALATVVTPQPIPRASVDPDDDVVLATAMAAKADLIVSGDQDLLSLHTFAGIPVVTAAEALTRIGSAL